MGATGKRELWHKQEVLVRGTSLGKERVGQWSKNWKNTTQLIKQAKYIYTHFRNFLNISRNGRKIGRFLTSKGWGKGQLCNSRKCFCVFPLQFN